MEGSKLPIVFVHGLTVRKGPGYQRTLDARDALFRRFALIELSERPGEARIENPYWGESASSFAWGGRSLPEGGGESFGLESPLVATLAGALAGKGEVAEERAMLEVARQSLPSAIDLIGAALAKDDGVPPNEFADLVVRLVRYAETNPEPSWLGEVADDEGFLNRLGEEIERDSPTEINSFGTSRFFEGIRRAGLAVRESFAVLVRMAGRTLSESVVEVGRGSLNLALGTFVGDLCVYLKNRGTVEAPGPIVQVTLDALRLAKDEARGEPLVAIGHSMGGNILYDIATYYAPELKIDVLVTVGSQVSLFEELKLFQASDPNVPGDQPSAVSVPRPANVGAWLNAYDEVDVLAYDTSLVFSDTVSGPFNTERALLSAHGAYFDLPHFHERLRLRLNEALKSIDADKHKENL
jgi:hypothetical protein